LLRSGRDAVRLFHDDSRKDAGRDKRDGDDQEDQVMTAHQS
jgi:hypothetical protein